jgi:hypothetical protein
LIIKKKVVFCFEHKKKRKPPLLLGSLSPPENENERLSAPGENERKQKKMVCYITMARSSLLLLSHFWTDGGGLPGEMPGPAMLGYK